MLHICDPFPVHQNNERCLQKGTGGVEVPSLCDAKFVSIISGVEGYVNTLRIPTKTPKAPYMLNDIRAQLHVKHRIRETNLR